MASTGNVKNKRTWRDSLYYFWLYYKIPALAVLAALLVAISFLYARVTQKETALSVMMLDIHADADDGELSREFEQYAGIDTDRYTVTVSTTQMLSDSESQNYTMGSLAKLYTSIGNGELDVCSMLEKDFGRYAEAGTFLDLSTVFSEEELAGFTRLYRDPEGKIIGVYAGDLPGIQKIGGYELEEGVIGILYNSGHTQNAGQFIQYLNQ